MADIAEVIIYYRAIFEAARDRFADGSQLLARFEAAAKRPTRGDGRADEQAHNELAVAAALLGMTEPALTRLRYEPRLPRCTKRIDFYVELSDQTLAYVEVKSVQPVMKDAWESFDEARAGGRLPPNIELVLSQEWLGGELWHLKTAARARFLVYVQEFEATLAECRLLAPNTRSILVFCGTGFHWHRDELEDFVDFYMRGVHRQDDPLRVMEQHYLNEKQIELRRSISSIAYLRRGAGALAPSEVHWRVRGPTIPF
jgi:hypothetical protein